MNIIIEDRFRLYKNGLLQYDVKLTLDTLSYSYNSTKIAHNVIHTQSMNDIVGCALMKSNKNELKNKVFLSIYSYPIINEKRKKRRKKVTIFEIATKETFDGNLQVAHTWRKLLYSAMYHSKGKSFILQK